MEVLRSCVDCRGKEQSTAQMKGGTDIYCVGEKSPSAGIFTLLYPGRAGNSLCSPAYSCLPEVYKHFLPSFPNNITFITSFTSCCLKGWKKTPNLPKAVLWHCPMAVCAGYIPQEGKSAGSAGKLCRTQGWTHGAATAGLCRCLPCSPLYF